MSNDRPYRHQAEAWLDRATLGRRLDQLPDNAARIAQCMAWAEECRNAFFTGQAETIAAVLASNAARFQGMDVRTREILGRRIWATSFHAKDALSDEALFRGWALMYAGSVTAGNR
jgi:hypothetical protein